MMPKREYYGYVRTDSDQILVQLPDNGNWGFRLVDEDQAWPGGIGVARTWSAVRDSDVSQEDRDRLGWIIEEFEASEMGEGR